MVVLYTREYHSRDRMVKRKTNTKYVLPFVLTCAASAIASVSKREGMGLPYCFLYSNACSRARFTCAQRHLPYAASAVIRAIYVTMANCFTIYLGSI